MHDLGEFMKGLLQRFTQWFNRAHSRTGRLWEDRFKSVIAEDCVGRDGKTITKTRRKGIPKEGAERERKKDGEIPFGKMLRCRVRYFTDGAVIGSRSFVDPAFAKSRERFGSKRKTGARRLKGDAAPASRALWSLRELRKGIA